MESSWAKKTNTSVLVVGYLPYKFLAPFAIQSDGILINKTEAVFLNLFKHSIVVNFLGIMAYGGVALSGRI